MCGRFTLTVGGEELLRYFRLSGMLAEYRPRYNIAPGQPILVLTADGGGSNLRTMRWGLVPSWSKDPRSGYRLINARAETVAAKPAFREAFRRRRCLIPADGFYEWQKDSRGRRPWRITLPAGGLFTFPGIWERWLSPQGEELESCSLITSASNQMMAEIHDRMPVILTQRKEQERWLVETSLPALQRLLVPYRGRLRAYRVSPLVNSPANESADCLREEE